jgi:hypothetical protein
MSFPFRLYTAGAVRAALLALLAAPAIPVAAQPSVTFTPTMIPLPDAFPTNLTVADVTGDGRNDVVLGETWCGLDCELRVLPQTAGGFLGPVVAYPSPWAQDVAVGDFDDDGLADVLVNDGQLLQFYFETQGGTLVPGVARGPFHPAMTIATGDLNRDGRADLAGIRYLAATPAPHEIDVYRQKAGGGFDLSTLPFEGIESCAFCRIRIDDLDGDGRPDLHLLDEARRLQVFYQEADGSFVQTTYGIEELGFDPYWLVPGQFDDDPEPELAAVGFYPDPSQPGQPRFPLFIVDQVEPRRWAIGRTVSLEIGFHLHDVADLDGDGRSDLVGITFAGVGSHQARIYLQTEAGDLRPTQQFDLPWGNFQSPSIEIADLSQDGLPDVAIAVDNFGLVTLIRTNGSSKAPPPELFPAAIPGFGFTVRISGGSTAIPGTLVNACIPETVCVSGAVPQRAEVFLRVVGPKGNGRLWPTLVKFSTSRVDVWVHQLATGAVRHYRLPGAAPGKDVLPGLFDRNGFDPPAGTQASSLAAAAATAPPPPAGGDSWIIRGDYRVRARITTPSGTQRVREEIACIAETLCLSGAIPGRSEVFVRLVGPKPNGYLWPTIVKFTTSTVEVWIEQISTGEARYYRLEGAAPGQDRLDGLFDRNGFQ